MDMPSEATLRRDLAAAYRLAAKFGWDDTIYTHFSVRLPGVAPRFLINPFGLLFEEVRASDLIVVDMEGRVLREAFETPPDVKTIPTWESESKPRPSQTSQLTDADNKALLQHRGQDAAGIATAEGNTFHLHKGPGLVRDVFRTRNMRALPGNVGIGHVRYPTAGSAYNFAEAQPFYVNSPFGIVLGHNGNLTHTHELARRVRIALSPAIVQQIYGPTRELNVIAIEPGLERLLVQALGNTAGPALDPGVADILTQKAAEVALKQEEMGLPACLLVPDQIRNAISRLVRRVAPRLQVLAHSEIPETHTIRIGPILRGASA